MSKKRRIRRLTARNELPRKMNPFIDRYLSLISISIGAIIGFFIWFLFFRCKNEHCLNYYNPIPYMGVVGFNTWVTALFLFKNK